MIRFYGGKILTGDCEKGYNIIDGELVTDGSKIIYIGTEPMQNGVYEREVCLKNKLLIPSFKNAHTHSAMIFVRSLADDLPLQEWLFNRVFPLEDKLNAQYVYDFTRVAVLEYLTSGITASFDMYFEPDANAAANIDMSFRTVLCGAVSGSRDNAARAEWLYTKFNSLNPLVSATLGFHAEYTASEELIQAIADLSEKYSAPVFTHNSETRSEVENCIAKYGMTPTKLFCEKGVYNHGGGGYHNVWMSDEDIALFAEKGLYAVTCPASNMKLASGIAPLEKMRAAGVRLAVGTDGAASNNALDMFREMYLATALQKVSLYDPAALPAEYVLGMATKNSALAMGLKDCDELAVGKQADMVALDLNMPNMQPITNPIKNIVYSGSKQNVALTVVAGKILYENGNFYVGEDPEKIYAKAQRSLEELLSK